MHMIHVSVAAAVLVVGTAISASAAVTSGPQPGEKVGAFKVTKVTGNPDDGVADGKTLCYRCRMGQRPVVMIFARTPDAGLAKLIEKLEEEIEEHPDSKLTAFVNMIGNDPEKLKTQAAAFAAEHKIKRVALVVPEDAANGPPDFKIAPEADVTVVCYKEGTVQANHALAKDALCCETIDAIVEDSEKLVE